MAYGMPNLTAVLYLVYNGEFPKCTAHPLCTTILLIAEGCSPDYLNPLLKCVRLRSGVVPVAQYHHQAAQYTYNQRWPYSHVRYRVFISILQVLFAKVLVFLQWLFAVLREEFSVYTILAKMPLLVNTNSRNGKYRSMYCRPLPILKAYCFGYLHWNVLLFFKTNIFTSLKSVPIKWWLLDLTK